MKNQAFERKLFKIPCGTIFVAECSEDEECFQYYCQQELVQQLLPRVYYKPYKRKKCLEKHQIIQGIQMFMKIFYQGYFVPKKETAAYLLGYDNSKIEKISFYVPIAKNEDYSIGECKLCLVRKDKGNYIYSLNREAAIVELFRHIGPYSFNHSVREKISKIIKKKQMTLLLKTPDVPKWMQKELRKILKTKEFQEEKEKQIKKMKKSVNCNSKCHTRIDILSLPLCAFLWNFSHSIIF